ncbi:MAG: exodeoxyribonuclease VII large subunit [Gemmatimonadota bacterium]
MAPADEDTLDLFSAVSEEPASGDDEELSPSADEAFAPGEAPVWTVSELTRALRALLEDQLPELRVEGEVANWTRARSGHCYFTLKDEEAQIRCVMWRGDARRLPMDPEEGMSLRVVGRVTLYEVRGDLQLQVREVQAGDGEGLWRLAFERLRRKLQEEGLLAPERKRPIPAFPGTVGVVTSPTGAAIRDILTVLRRRAPWTRVLVRGTRVQGEEAAEEVAAAVRLLGGTAGVDVLIVGRGGGSIEDLWAFNEEPVARAIAECPVPVISAVGHETDVTISDLVADLRAPTPSAAAEAAVQDGSTLLEALESIRSRLARGLERQTDRRRHRLETLARRLDVAMRRILEPRRALLERWGERLAPAFLRRLEGDGRRVHDAGEALGRAVRGLILERRQRLARTAGRVEALSPLSTLKRGYAVPVGPGGRVLRRTEDFRAHPEFRLRVVDGKIRCEATEFWTDEDLR